MTETAFDRFWELVGGAIALKGEAFQLIQVLPLSTQAALLIAFLAGLSQGIGQAIVLFINRVKPIRFVLSLLIGAILYAFSYIFWAASTWIAILLFKKFSLATIVQTLGLAYAPLILSFLGAMPFIGSGILIVLSLWSLLAFVVGLMTATGFGIWQVFACGALGWGVFQILQRTIGRPIASIGKRLRNTIAGVELVTDLKKIEEIVQRELGNREQ